MKRTTWITLGLFIAICLIQPYADAAIINEENAGTWGISNDALTIPPDGVITEATLTLHNVRTMGSNPQALYVHLLDNPVQDIEEIADAKAGDFFEEFGTFLKKIEGSALSATPRDITLSLNQINDTAAWVWDIYDAPVVVTLGNASTTQLSSSQLALLDYAGTGGSFGFGLDCDGVAVDGASLVLTVQSTAQSTPPTELVFQIGDISGEIPAQLEFIIDNGNTGTSSTGTWQVSGATGSYGADSLWSRDGATYTWSQNSLTPGTYEVFMWWTEWSSRSTAAPVRITHANGSTDKTVNQKTNGSRWNSLGTYQFSGSASVRLSAPNASPTSYNADAVKFVKVTDSANNAPQLAAIADQSVAASSTLSVTVSATDADGDTVAITASNLPQGAGFTGRTFTWTPGATQIGVYQVTFTADDGKGGFDTASVQVTVTAPPTGEWQELVFDDFESGWGNYTDGGADCMLYTRTKYAPQGTTAANIQNGSGDASSFVLTNGIDVKTPGYSEIEVAFSYIPVSMDNSSEGFRLDVWDGTKWVTVKSWYAFVDFINFSLNRETVSISNSAVAFSTGMRIRFVCEASDHIDDVMIDDISISAR